MVAAGFLAAAAAVAYLMREAIADQVRAQENLQVQILGSIAEQAAALDNPELLRGYMDLLRSAADVEFAAVVDHAGKIAAHTDREFIGADLKIWRLSDRYPTAVQWQAPARLPGGAATVMIGFSRSHSDALVGAARKKMLIPLASIGAAAFAVCLGLALYFASYLSRSINQLIEGSRQIGRGNLKVSLPVSSSGEFGQLESQFNAMAEQLRHLEEARDRLVAGLSHDLRTPLGAMQTYLGVIREGLFGPTSREQDRALGIIMDGSRKLSDMVNNALDLFSIKAGRFQVRPTPTDIGELVKQAAQLYQATADSRRISIRCEIADGLGKVSADAPGITRVVANLVSNALKFTPEGGSVTVSAADAVNEVRVAVKDTGKGIAQADLPKLFAPFERLREGATGATEGTGLGLMVSRQIVEAHQGRIWIESELGRGTTVAFSLPKSQTLSARHA